MPSILFVGQINSLVCDRQRIAIKRVNPFLSVKKRQIHLIVIIHSSSIKEFY